MKVLQNYFLNLTFFNDTQIVYQTNFIFFIISILFLGFVCLIFTKNSFIKTLILMELVFILICLLLVFFSLIYDSPEGQILILYILGISACETALGLSIYIAYSSYIF